MWLRVILSASLVVLVASALGLDSSLEGHSVLRVVPETPGQLAALHKYLRANRHVSFDSCFLGTTVHTHDPRHPPPV